MDRVNRLVEHHFQVTSGVLVLDGVPITAVAEQHGTPFFVYSHHVLEQKWASLRNALPKEVSVSYSVKANPNQALLTFFLGKGCGLEVASGGEFYQARLAGCPASEILFAGPGKTEAELEYALGEGIGEIHLESRLEAERVAALSRRTGIRARVAVRVNPTGEVQGGAMRMGGKPVPFGVDEEVLGSFLDLIQSDPALDFTGIHLFAGTQILDAQILLAQYCHGIRLAREVASSLQRPLKTVDFGGGLGIPYFPNERELDMARLREGFEDLMKETRTDRWLSGTQFTVEPGRYLVGEAGIYVARVNDIKISRGKKFLVTDGGMHHHLAASGNLGQTIKRNYPVALVNRLTSTPTETVEVTGPLCTPLDVLARSITLPVTEVGDLVGVFQSGAYARAASPLGFLSHPTPPEVLAEAGQCRLIRRRGRFADCLSDLQGL
ncbi:MAG: type III PLP-dependent enzyme [Acidobacteria bacterium]|nr:type III PLP-dependent enzyme [Acidobacteriota bacterium]MCI0621696.1 type III PLP-dependent enzyme [Acidobacteriota bacterium]MCI0724262.1 type III PLP-dependent enzyme [Acidobacteriota bacterium]